MGARSALSLSGARTLTLRCPTTYQVPGLRLETFSKEHAYVFTESNRAESSDNSATKFMIITLVESVEMVVEVDRILVHPASMPRALQFPPCTCQERYNSPLHMPRALQFYDWTTRI